MFLFRQCLILFITMSSSSIETEKVAIWFVYAAIINTILALLYVTVFLLPDTIGNGHIPPSGDLFSLSIAVASFPGTWLLIAFFVHVFVGILGMVGWAGIYYISSRVMNRQTTNKLLARSHLVLTALGVYVTTTFFALAGFIGGRAMLPEPACIVLADQCMGAGAAIVQTLIKFTVIPTGIGMGLALTGTAIGIINILITLRQPQ